MGDIAITRWRSTFLETYEQVISHPHDRDCLVATEDNKWLKQELSARDQTEIRIKRANEARRERLGIR